MTKRTNAKTAAKRTVRKKAARGAASAPKANKKQSAKPARKKKSASKGASIRPTTRRPGSASESSVPLKTKAAPGKSKGRKGTTAKKTPARLTGTKPARSTTAPTATLQDPIEFPEESRSLPKTHLSDKELQEFKELLLRKRAELCGDVERLTHEALASKGQGNTEHSAMPIHMADLGTDNWEQEFTLGLIANEQALVREIDEALARIEDGTYGICLATHKKISKARLRAKPWAKYCIAYARAREEGRAF